MLTEAIRGAIATRKSVHEYLTEMENHYDCSIKFWISIEKPPDKEVSVYVYASGSGAVFDRLKSDRGVVHSRVLDAQQGSIYPALRACLLQLEFEFAGVTIPVTNARPM